MTSTTYTLKSGHTAEAGSGIARVTVDGHTFDLAGLVRTDSQITDAQWAALVTPEKATDARVGQVAWVRALGCFRRGVVTKVGRTNITVAVTTQGALDESTRWGGKARIQETSAACGMVRLEVPPVTQPEPELEEAPASSAPQEIPAEDTVAQVAAEVAGYGDLLAETEEPQAETAELAAGPVARLLERQTRKAVREMETGSPAGLVEVLVPAECPNPWHRTAPARTAQTCPECPKPASIQEEAPAEAGWMTDQAEVDALLEEVLGPEVEVTRDQALSAIGRCWAGGKMTGKALESFQAGHYRAALELAQLQVAAQEDPEAGRVVRKDVVTIHRGEKRYEVLEVSRDSGYDATRTRTPGPADWTDHSMVRVMCLDPADGGDPFWVSMDLVHRVPVAARLTTVTVAEYQRLTDQPVMVEGTGWDLDRGAYRQVATVDAPGSRLPFPVLLPWPGGRIPATVPTLRIGDAIVVDGRCFQVVWDGGPVEAHLEPARWRDR